MIYTWAIPIKSGNTTIGVICIDIPIDSIYNILDSIKLFEGTTTTLFDNSGFIVYDSDKKEYIFKELHDIYPFYKEHNVFDNIINGKDVLFQAFSGTLKKNYTYSFTPMEIIENKYWGLKITAPNSVILKDSNTIRNVMFLISMIIIIVISIIVPLILKMKVTNIISKINVDIKKLSNGDISWQTSKHFSMRNDEWGDIAKNLDATIDNLNNIVSTVKNSADSVSNAANDVLMGNNDLSQRTEA